MELLHAREIALDLMRQHGLIEKGWRFEYNHAKRSYGKCRYGKYDHARNGIIYLSQHLVHLNNEENTRDTILHEIAHALTPGHGHDSVWRRKALEIGADGERCYTEEHVITPKGTYLAVCPNGHEHYRFKQTSKRTSCGKCERRFNPNALLVFERIAK